MIRRLLLLLVVPSMFLYSCVPGDDNTPIPEENRDEYTGTWNAVEVSQIYGSSHYQVSISKGAAEGELLLGNIYNLGFKYNAEMFLSGTSLTIPFQTVSGHSITGTGSFISGESASLSLTVNDGSGDDQVDITLSR